jgi:inner membrane transporter RhtA
VLLPLLATTAAMACFQAGAAVAKGLFPAVGPQGAAALRLAFGALFLIAIGRPWRRWPSPAPLGPIVGLGLAVAGSVLCFFQALTHLPLGVALPLQFIGPLGVAVATSRKASDLLWTVLAAAGVWSLVGAGQGSAPIDLRGVPWALGAAVGWASYILCGRAAGAAWGQAAAPLSLGIAAVILLPVGIVHAGAALFDPALLPLALGVGLLSGALPFALELYAMPRLPARTFATYTSLEPAFSVLVGLIVLHERLAPIQLAGVTAVIAAAAGATWSSAGRAAPATPGA